MSQVWRFISGVLFALFLTCSMGCGTINILVLKYEGFKLADKGHYPEAAVKLEKGLELTKQSENMLDFFHLNKRIQRAFLGNLGWVCKAMGQYDRAMDYHQQALAINREIKKRRFEAGDLAAIAGVYEAMGQYDRAVDYFQQALAINKEAKDCLLQGNLLGTMGWRSYVRGEYDRAIEYYQQALAVHRAFCIQPFNRPFEWRNVGGEAGDLAGLGCIYGDMGQHELGQEYLKQALVIFRKLKDRAGEGSVLNNLGNGYYKMGQHDLARNALEESIKIAREGGSAELLWRAHRGLGAVEVKLANFGKGIQHYRQALDTIEGIRAGLGAKENKTSFMQNKFYVYDELLEVLRTLHEKDPAKGYDRDSLEIFERKQGRLFLEEMGQSGARSFAGLPEEVRNQESELENRLAGLQTILEKERAKSKPNLERLQSLEKEWQQAQTAFQTLKTEFQTKYPDYHALKYPQPAKLAELQHQVLKPGETMLVYAVLDDKTCLWVIGKEVFQLHTLPMGEKDLSKKIGDFRQKFLLTGDDGRGAPSKAREAFNKVDKSGKELFGLLVPAPVRPILAPGSRLYIIPTGPLYALPFEALETQAAGQPAHYLVEDFSLAYLSSASLLKTLREAQTRKQTQPPYPLLAFANPSYGKDSGIKADDRSIRGLQTRAYQEITRGIFAELPETEDEAREIKELLKAPEQTKPIYVKEAASRSTVFSLNRSGELPNYRYLVFACHGVLPGEVDLVAQPALVLSNPEKEGYLTMGDVFGLKFNADLVSLSACNTGRGSEVKGEGIIGLTRAFMFAGTPAVAVTLWAVESLSAKEVNVGMYRYLSHKPARAEALRGIKLDMLRGVKGEQYRSPFYWAPLVVFGDGQ